MISHLRWQLLGAGGQILSPTNFRIEQVQIPGGLDFKLEFLEECRVSEVFLEFLPASPIKGWRFLDYTWKELSDSILVANEHSPKILQLEDSGFLAAKTVRGCWEYLPGRSKIHWYFFHPMLTPTLVFDAKDERIFLPDQVIAKGTVIESGWRWGRGGVEEWARTPLGFVSTICFTDHSDFDTVENLKIQREFFKSSGIKITKGFFLYDYTHKKENASFEDPKGREELKKWQNDGHELAYHALSQSYRGSRSEDEFENFASPQGLDVVRTYIDHGFHPYNYTKQALGNWDRWYSHVAGKGVRRFWTYVDAGEGNVFNSNQLNPQNFTWATMKASSRWAKANQLNRMRKTDFRNFLMYGVPESILQKVKVSASKFWALKKKPSIGSLIGFLRVAFLLLIELFRPSSWKEIALKSREIFPVNRFGTLFFRASNQKTTELIAFQTLAVRDYDLVFSAQSMESFLKESGLMIAHTYFAYIGQNHEGRLFENGDWRIRETAAEAFERISNGIKSGKLWNPTLQELQDFHRKFEKLEYTVKEEKLVILNFDGTKREIV